MSQNSLAYASRDSQNQEQKANTNRTMNNAHVARVLDPNSDEIAELRYDNQAMLPPGPRCCTRRTVSEVLVEGGAWLERLRAAVPPGAIRLPLPHLQSGPPAPPANS
eukprot:8724066-Pyramimonas_sp.AAC.1